MSIVKKLIRTGVIVGVVAGVAVGGTLLVAGPERGAAILHQIQDGVIEVIDDNLDDPVAMRSQLRELQREYPERISQVRGDMAELDEQIRQLEREKAVSERVVTLATADLEELGPALGDLRGADGTVRLASARALDAAAAKHAETRERKIRQTQAIYANRAAEADHDLHYLRQQSGRMEEILAKLENEYAQFQTQIWQLERQVDAIARNNRLIGLLEERQQTIDEMSRFEVASLDHLVSRLSELRSRQEAELELLSSDQQRVDYESMARMELQQEARSDELPRSYDLGAR